MESEKENSVIWLKTLQTLGSQLVSNSKIALWNFDKILAINSIIFQSKSIKKLGEFSK